MLFTAQLQIQIEGSLLVFLFGERQRLLGRQLKLATTLVLRFFQIDDLRVHVRTCIVHHESFVGRIQHSRFERILLLDVGDLSQREGISNSCDLRTLFDGEILLLHILHDLLVLLPELQLESFRVIHCPLEVVLDALAGGVIRNHFLDLLSDFLFQLIVGRLFVELKR